MAATLEGLSGPGVAGGDPPVRARRAPSFLHLGLAQVRAGPGAARARVPRVPLRLRHARFSAMVFGTSGCEREDLMLLPGAEAAAGSVAASPGKKSKDSAVGKELVPYRAPPSDQRLQAAACAEEGTPKMGKRTVLL
jgi:hypothetical protein